MLIRLFTVLCLLASVATAGVRQVFIDDKGVIRWTDTGEESSFFGVNYCLPSASDYRAAGYVNADRKKLIDVDMAHLARMGFNGLRLSFWGDYQNSDHKGNLVANDHLDLLDYLIARAGERGMSMLLSPIVTHSSQWPDLMREKAIGFSEAFPKRELGLDPKAIAAQANYLRQLLNHVNPYTGVALKDEPAIQFIELVNEPWHHSRDVEGSVRYINALADAVRETGCDKPLFHNLSQDFGIAKAINQSKVQGYTVGWYPNGLVSGHTQRGNFLRHVDDYAELRAEALANRPRLVYEFDAGDVMAPYMYPAMARAFRAGGVQFAAMFSYDMLDTAPFNLGWQTHYFNLVYTPKKAIGAVIAAEAMRRLPRFQTYGKYPANTRFGEVRVSAEEDLAELVSDDVFLYANNTRTAPPAPAKLKRIAGVGSSPIVRYEGTGAYFLDKLDDGVWRLEVYPDAVPLRDPFEPMSVDKVVTRIISRAWPMWIELPDLGATFFMRAIDDAGAVPVQAKDAMIAAKPGVYLLSREAAVQADRLPKSVGNVGLAEFHSPTPQSLSRSVEWMDRHDEIVAGEPFTFRARVADESSNPTVTLWLRKSGDPRFEPHRMSRTAAYEFAVDLAGETIEQGIYAVCVSVEDSQGVETFPGSAKALPNDWNFSDNDLWTLRAVPTTSPLRLFDPEKDLQRVSITRQGDPSFELASGDASRASSLRIHRPVRNGWAPPNTTASLYVGDRVQARASTLNKSTGVRIRARSDATDVPLILTVVERDGTSWETIVRLSTEWKDHEIRWSEFHIGRGVMMPQAFPNLSAYWSEPAEGRGGAGDAVRLPDLERLQFSLRTASDGKGGAGDERNATTLDVDIESVEMLFE